MKTEAEYLAMAYASNTSELIQVISKWETIKIQVESQGGESVLELADSFGQLFGDLLGVEKGSKFGGTRSSESYKELKLLAKVAAEVLDQRLKPHACECPCAPLA